MRYIIYNYVDFGEQLEKFERDLFGVGCVDTRAAAEEASRRYYPPKGMKILKCKEDINGEWVPNPVPKPKGRDD